MKEILIIRLSSIGDVLHCTPVAKTLKTAWPNCKITWLVGEMCAQLLQYNPYVDELLIWSREKFEKHLHHRAWKKAWKLWQELRGMLIPRSFYAVLDIHGLFLTGMMARMPKAERIIGMSQAKEGNPFFMKETATFKGSHVTERYLAVLKPLGITATDDTMTLTLSDESKTFAGRFYQNMKVGSQKKAVLVPATTWFSKNWPADYYAALTDLLHPTYSVILCGGPGDKKIGDEIKAKSQGHITDAIGKTSLLEMAAIIEKADVVISGDTGPLHIAAALKVPTVSVFGPTNPKMYGPKGHLHRKLVHFMPCSFCHKKQCRLGTQACMKSILPKTVAAEVLQSGINWRKTKRIKKSKREMFPAR